MEVLLCVSNNVETGIASTLLQLRVHLEETGECNHQFCHLFYICSCLLQQLCRSHQQSVPSSTQLLLLTPTLPLRFPIHVVKLVKLILHLFYRTSTIAIVSKTSYENPLRTSSLPRSKIPDTRGKNARSTLLTAVNAVMGRS